MTEAGDWLFNAANTLKYANQEDGLWGEIAVAKRDTRKTIQAAADAYLDIFNDKSVKVPWGTPCARLEGGSYTGKGQPTDSKSFSSTKGSNTSSFVQLFSPLHPTDSYFPHC